MAHWNATKVCTCTCHCTLPSLFAARPDREWLDGWIVDPWTGLRSSSRAVSLEHGSPAPFLDIQKSCRQNEGGSGPSLLVLPGLGPVETATAQDHAGKARHSMFCGGRHLGAYLDGVT